MEPQSSSYSRETNQWAMILHISQLAGYVIPGAGWVIPIVIWQVKKTEMPQLDAHGKVVMNWLLSVLVYGMVSSLLLLALIGVPLLIALGMLCLIFPIVGAVKATSGVVWKYPLSIPFL
jgi:uncharacterized Tic20 family protein